MRGDRVIVVHQRVQRRGIEHQRGVAVIRIAAIQPFLDFLVAVHQHQLRQILHCDLIARFLYHLDDEGRRVIAVGECLLHVVVFRGMINAEPLRLDIRYKRRRRNRIFDDILDVLIA